MAGRAAEIPSCGASSNSARRLRARAHPSSARRSWGSPPNSSAISTPRLDAPPLNPGWVQVDLRSTQRLDWIALVPAQLDFQSVDRTALRLPRNAFVWTFPDDREFVTFTTVANFTESDFPDPGVAPVAVKLAGQNARYVRVTVTKFALENGQYISSRSPSSWSSPAIATSPSTGPVSVSGRYELPPRWSQQYLVDGRTPRSARRSAASCSATTACSPTCRGDNSPAVMQVDLGAHLRVAGSAACTPSMRASARTCRASPFPKPSASRPARTPNSPPRSRSSRASTIPIRATIPSRCP